MIYFISLEKKYKQNQRNSTITEYIKNHCKHIKRAERWRSKY